MGTTTATAMVPCWLSPWLTGFEVWRTPVVDAEVDDVMEEEVVVDGGVVEVEVLKTTTVEVEEVEEGVVDVEEVVEVVDEEVVVVDEVVDDEDDVVEVVDEDEELTGREVDDWEEEDVAGAVEVVGSAEVLGVVEVVGAVGVVGVGTDGPVLVVFDDMVRAVNTSLARCLSAAMLAVLGGAIDRDGTRRTAAR